MEFGKLLKSVFFEAFCEAGITILQDVKKNKGKAVSRKPVLKKKRLVKEEEK